MATVQIHRFRTRAAVSAGATLYVTAADARKLARHLYKVARSIEQEEFSTSTVGTIEVPAAAANEPWKESDNA